MGEMYRRMRPLLGTFVEIAISEKSEQAVTAAYDAISQIHDLMSFQNPNSDLNRLNKSQGEYVRLHPLTRRVLKLALGMTRASHNLFNCTVAGELIDLGVLPNHGGPKPLSMGTPDDVEFRGRDVRLKRPVRITLDGIAKGFAVDQAIKVLKRAGIRSGWVNAGGDLRVFGELSLPVQRRESDGTLVPLIQLQKSAVATSESRVRTNSRYPGQIVGTGTIEAGIWSVAASKAWRADALTKVASLAGATQRRQLVEQLGGRLITTSESL
jgi:FAD:protein FMN transferase